MEDSRCRMMRWGPLRTSYCVLRKGAFINDTSEATDEVNTQYDTSEATDGAKRSKYAIYSEDIMQHLF